MDCSFGDAPVKRQFDWSTTDPSHAVVLGVAELEGVEATRLPEKFDTTLSDHVDPDALDTLVRSEARVVISFTYEEYSIQIEGDTLFASR
ncbi:HalOD1 output domain-containing protein [Halosimplex halophilum]|uniref:HalOD1 output domain-containing protein n=1 Tax=Halosimplex halophilum TaxID=2559572 RepID=UPI001FEC6E1F|nr:HalOD1 output domain-containing protein [Halosimplex halophilum]